MRVTELALPDLKRRGHLGRGRSTIVRKTHQRKNQEVDNTLVSVRDQCSHVTRWSPSVVWWLAGPQVCEWWKAQTGLFLGSTRPRQEAIPVTAGG